MTEPQKKSSTGGSLAARLKVVTDTTPPAVKKAPREPAAKKAAPRKTASTAPPIRRPEYADTPASQRYTEKLTIHVTPEMARVLAVGKADDKISAAARIRGMLELYNEGQPDPTNPDAPDTPSRYNKAVNERARRHRG